MVMPGLRLSFQFVVKEEPVLEKSFLVKYSNPPREESLIKGVNRVERRDIDPSQVYSHGP